MTVKKSERLIVKFITNQASKDEIEALNEWLKEEENQIVFKDFVKINYAVDAATYTFDSSEVKKQLTERIQKEKNVFQKRRFSSYYKYAAIFILVLGGFYFYQNSNLFHHKENVVVPRQDDIVLQLGNESTETADSYKKGIITSPDQVGGYPDYKGIAYKDSDNDGIADAWEKKYGLNPKDASDANKDLNGDGYTNIEKYFNGIDPTQKTDWTKTNNNVDTLAQSKGLLQ
jgi:transmembrane sensor